MKDKQSINEVRDFWNKNPLFVGESNYKCHSKHFFLELEKVKTEDCFAGQIEDFCFQGLEGKKVIDVGCGTGFWVREFCKRGIETYAVDLSPVAVDVTRKSLLYFGYNATVEVGNAEELPFDDGIFDHVNCHGVIHHTPNTQKCINEFFRVLKPGGTVVFSVYYRNIFFKSRLLFYFVKTMGKIVSIGLKGRGRESLFTEASSADELVRMYDGKDNPIGKCYTKIEIIKMTSPYFDIQSITKHLFPARALPFKIPKKIHKFLRRHFGLMLLIYGKKKQTNFYTVDKLKFDNNHKNVS